MRVLKGAWLSGDLVWLILVGAGWLAQRINAAKKKAAQTRPGAGSAPPGRAGADQSELTRRVQEEVRRKIEARRAAESRSREIPRELPPVYVPPPAPVLESPDAPDWDRPPADQPPPVDDLAEKIRAQEAAEAAALIREQLGNLPEAAPILGQAATPAAAPRSPWLADLRDPAQVRRAVVLREILGPPVGLRR